MARKRLFSLYEPDPAEVERLHPALRELPRRISETNAMGPRYSQTELAEAAGLHHTVLSKLAASDNLYGLRADTLIRIAEALGVSTSWLLGETDNPARAQLVKRRPEPPPPAKAPPPPPEPPAPPAPPPGAQRAKASSTKPSATKPLAATKRRPRR